MFVSPQNSCIESLVPNMIVFGDGPLWKNLKEVIRMGSCSNGGLSLLYLTTQGEMSVCTLGGGHPTNSPADLGLRLLAPEL